jgi:hypothetical protein
MYLYLCLCIMYVCTQGDTAAAQALFALEKGGMRPSDRPVLTHCQVHDLHALIIHRHAHIIAHMHETHMARKETEDMINTYMT